MTTPRTLGQITQLADTDVLAHLDLQVDVPLLTNVQPQGDVIVIPSPRPTGMEAGTPLPQAGVPVVRGENGGNTHLLIGNGPVMFDAGRTGAQTLGTLTVAAGSSAYLIHPEHGAAGVGPGTYVIRRQREQADSVRLVAD